MVYVIILNGRVVCTAKTAEMAEKLKSIVENCCNVLMTQSGAVVSYSIEVELWEEL